MRIQTNRSVNCRAAANRSAGFGIEPNDNKLILVAESSPKPRRIFIVGDGAPLHPAGRRSPHPPQERVGPFALPEATFFAGSFDGTISVLVDIHSAVNSKPWSASSAGL
jgi:hypothetical protein